MEINDKDIDRVAEVARLRLSNEEKGLFLPQMKEILEYFKLLDDAKVDKEIKIHAVYMEEHLREDVVKGCVEQNKLLKLSTHIKGDYFNGPKVVE